MKNFTIIISVALAIMIFIAGWYLKPVEIINTTPEYLADGVVRISKAYKSQRELNKIIEAEAQGLKAQLKNKATIIAVLNAKIEELNYTGTARPIENGWAEYQEPDIVNVKYKGQPDSVKVKLFDRPVKVFLAQDKTDKWYARIEDVKLKKQLTISDIFIAEKKPSWYKKLVVIAKYTGVAVVSGGAGYLVGKVF